MIHSFEKILIHKTAKNIVAISSSLRFAFLYKKIILNYITRYISVALCGGSSALDQFCF
jgi:hypothetical protein